VNKTSITFLAGVFLSAFFSFSAFSDDTATIYFGESKISIASSVARLTTIDDLPVVEVFLFNQELSDEEKEEVSQAENDSFKKNIDESHVAKIQLYLEENSQSLNIDNIFCYSIYFFAPDESLLPFTMQFAGWSYSGFSKIGDYGVMRLEGNLQKGELITAVIKGEEIATKKNARLPPDTEKLALRWDLSINSKLFEKE